MKRSPFFVVALASLAAACGGGGEDVATAKTVQDLMYEMPETTHLQMYAKIPGFFVGAPSDAWMLATETVRNGSLRWEGFFLDTAGATKTDGSAYAAGDSFCQGAGLDNSESFETIPNVDPTKRMVASEKVNDMARTNCAGMAGLESRFIWEIETPESMATGNKVCNWTALVSEDEAMPAQMWDNPAGPAYCWTICNEADHVGSLQGSVWGLQGYCEVQPWPG